MNSAIKSLVLAAGQHGVNLSVDRLMHENALSEEHETDSKTLLKIAKKNNLKTKIIKGTWENITSLGTAFPVIAILSNGRYVVIAKCQLATADDENPEVEDSVFVLDPIAVNPKLEEIPKDKFLASWKGELILLKSNFSLLDEDQPFSKNWIYQEIFSNKALFLQLLFVSLLLHVFGFLPIIYIMIVLDKVVNYEAMSTLYVIAGGVLVAHIFSGVFGYIKRYIALFFTSKLEVKLNQKSFSSVLDQPLDYFHKNSTSSIVKTMQQVTTIRQFMINKVFGTILDATGLLIFVPILILFSPTLFGIVMIFSVLIGINNILAAKKQKEMHQLVSKFEEQKQSIMMNTVSGIDTVKSLTLEPSLRKNWEEFATNHTLASLELGKLDAKSSQISATLQQLMTVAVIFVGVLLVFAGSLSAGVLIGVNMLAGKVTGPLVQLVAMSTELQKFSMAMSMMSKLLNLRGERLRRGVTPSIQGGVTFENVSFGYKETEGVISNVSFDIKPRQKIGLVGPSGSGKTTIMRLIQGIIKPNSGTILIDGHDINTLDLSHLRVNISIIASQNTFFKGSIRENILHAMPNAPEERSEWVYEMVGMNENICELKDGLNTMIEEGGTNLSTGMRQKVAFARGLIRNPKIMMMDEVFSGMSLQDEMSIMHNMPKINQGRTMLIVTHELSQVLDCDKILVLNSKGELAEQGTHEELLKNNGVYADLWNQERSLRGSLGNANTGKVANG